MFMYWSGESIVRLSDQSDSKFSGFDLLIGNGIKVGFHAVRVKREEETVLAFILGGKVDDGCPWPPASPALQQMVPAGYQKPRQPPRIWVERRELQPVQPMSYSSCHLGVAHDPSGPLRPAG